MAGKNIVQHLQMAGVFERIIIIIKSSYFTASKGIGPAKNTFEAASLSLRLKTIRCEILLPGGY